MPLFDDIGYRPPQQDIERATEAAKLEASVLFAKINSNNMEDGIKDDPLPEDIGDLTNDQINDYILDFNRGKIEPTLANTIRFFALLEIQAAKVKSRATEVKSHIKKTLPNIPVPLHLKGDVNLIYGEDAKELTPDMIDCAQKIIQQQENFITQNQEGPANNIVADVIGDKKSVLNMPNIPKDKDEFNAQFKNAFDTDNLFDWNALTFLIMLLQVVLETVTLLLFTPICKIKVMGIKVGEWIAEGINVEWGEIKDKPVKGINWAYISKVTVPGPLAVTGALIGRALRCSSVQDLDLGLLLKSRLTDITDYVKRGGTFDADEIVPGEDGLGPKKQSSMLTDNRTAICPNKSKRNPSPQEVLAAKNIVDVSMDAAKNAEQNQKLKNLQGMLACSSAEEECVVFSATCGNMKDKMNLVGESGKGTAALLKTDTTALGKANAALDESVVKYTQILGENLRNIDMMVSTALELDFLGDRWKDVICCFIRLFYALFVGNDDFAIGDNKRDPQQVVTDWQSQYEDIAKKVADKVQLLAQVADAILSTFTTTVSTNFQIKLGDFSLAQFGQFVVSVFRKTIFELLITVNEMLFGSIRRLIFGGLNALMSESDELKAAMDDCTLFQIAINWMQCLLNFLQNKIVQLLMQIRSQSDSSWGQIEMKLDFAFQNKQVSFLRDLFQLIGKWSFEIVTICNVNNINSGDAFQDLVSNITKELGYDPYNPYNEDDPEYFDFGIRKDIATSVMRPADDHSRNQDSNTRNFLRKAKGDFGFNYKDFIVVDQDGKTSDNISKTNQDTESQQAASKDKIDNRNKQTYIIPDTVNTSKEAFNRKCTAVYTNVSDIIKNDTKLKDIFKRYDIYTEFAHGQ